MIIITCNYLMTELWATLMKPPRNQRETKSVSEHNLEWTANQQLGSRLSTPFLRGTVPRCRRCLSASAFLHTFRPPAVLSCPPQWCCWWGWRPASLCSQWSPWWRSQWHKRRQSSWTLEIVDSCGLLWAVIKNDWLLQNGQKTQKTGQFKIAQQAQQGPMNLKS